MSVPIWVKVKVVAQVHGVENMSSSASASASALASGAASSGAPSLLIRKVSTQQAPTEANTKDSTSKDSTSRTVNRWRVRRRIQRLLRGALPESEWGRVNRCGWSMGSLVSLLGASGGRASWSGVEHCNGIWSCPVCAARIREGRRAEILKAVHQARERKWRMFFVTFTVPHSIETPLRDSLRGLTSAFRRIRNYKSLTPFWSAMVGFIKAVEVQVGSNGFHPHLHVLIITNGCDLVNDEIEKKLKSSWAQAVVKEGLARPKDEVGVVVEETLDPEVTADYLVKIQENKLTLELSRSDLKGGREGKSKGEWHCAPFDLMTPEVELPISVGLRKRLFVEFYSATKGVSAIRWSRGLKDLFSLEEVSDEELGSLSPEEAEAELRFLKKVYQELFKEKPDVLAQCQALFKEEKYKEAAALVEGYGELLLDDGTRFHWGIGQWEVTLDDSVALPPDPWASVC